MAPAVKLNRAKLQSAIQLATKAAAERLLVESSEAIASSSWDYPVAPSPRDIVDSGRLLRAGRVVKIQRGWALAWDVPYARAIYNGYTTKAGLRVPPRRWVNVARSRVDLSGEFAKVSRGAL